MVGATFVNELLKICQINVCHERSYLSVGPQYAMDLKQCHYDRLMVTPIDQGSIVLTDIGPGFSLLSKQMLWPL